MGIVTPRYRAHYLAMPSLSPIESEFTSTEEAEAYDAWFHAKVESVLANLSPDISHQEAVSRIDAVLDRFEA